MILSIRAISTVYFLCWGLVAIAQKSPKVNLDEIAKKFALASLQGFCNLHSLPNDAPFPSDIEKNVQRCENVSGDYDGEVMI
jgi:hypothetical protein